jgi:uncharacterized protein YjbJ (UPF0337 family)
MTLNTNIAKGKWLEIKGEIQKAWGNLTDDELEKTKGDMKAVSGLIQQRYGNVQKDYKEKLSKIFKKMEEEKDLINDQAKKSLKH